MCEGVLYFSVCMRVYECLKIFDRFVADVRVEVYWQVWIVLEILFDVGLVCTFLEFWV